MRNFLIKTDGNGRRKLSGAGFIIVMVIMFVGVGVIGDVVGKLTRPHRYAMAYGCRATEPNEAGAYFANTCGKDINLRYCLFLDYGTEPAFCRTTELAPGEGVSTYIADRLELKARAGESAEITRVDIWSCKAPLEPGIVSNMHKPSQKERGCLPLKK